MEEDPDPATHRCCLMWSDGCISNFHYSAGAEYVWRSHRITALFQGLLIDPDHVYNDLRVVRRRDLVDAHKSVTGHVYDDTFSKALFESASTETLLFVVIPDSLYYGTIRGKRLNFTIRKGFDHRLLLHRSVKWDFKQFIGFRPSKEYGVVTMQRKMVA